MNHIRKLLTNLLAQPIIQYFIMAACLVALEIGSFALLNSGLHLTYLAATPLSMGFVVILNWYLGRRFIFKAKRYRAHTEFALVALVSVVGLGIQLAVTSFVVEVVNLLPIIGKCLAIGVTFFWNYWTRKRFIFKESLSNQIIP